MESGVIKNPIDYFDFDFENHGTLDNEIDGKLICYLHHETLPIMIEGSVDYKLKEGKIPKESYRISIARAYSKLYNTIVNGKSKPMQKGWHTRWYYPEWDTELNLWFIMDKDGNKCYSQDDIPSYVVDELNTD